MLRHRTVNLRLTTGSGRSKCVRLVADLPRGRHLRPFFAERSTLFWMLGATPDGHRAERVADALTTYHRFARRAPARLLPADQWHEVTLCRHVSGLSGRNAPCPCSGMSGRRIRPFEGSLPARCVVSLLAMTPESEFEKGLKIRREVLGDAFVDANLAATDDFMMTFQHLVTELAWARAWGGGTLDRKTKSLLSLGILAASGRFQEVGIYAKGALNSGASVEEIKEVLTHVTIYCGTPAGRQSFLAVHETLKAEGIAPN